MMSQILHSNQNVLESDENVNIPLDSQDFFSSKNEFTQSVLHQVDQMSQFIRKYDNDKEITNEDPAFVGLCGGSVDKEKPKPLSELFESNIDYNSEGKISQLDKDKLQESNRSSVLVE